MTKTTYEAPQADLVKVILTGKLLQASMEALSSKVGTWDVEEED